VETRLQHGATAVRLPPVRAARRGAGVSALQCCTREHLDPADPIERERRAQPASIAVLCSGRVETRIAVPRAISPGGEQSRVIALPDARGCAANTHLNAISTISFGFRATKCTIRLSLRTAVVSLRMRRPVVLLTVQHIFLDKGTRACNPRSIGLRPGLPGIPRASYRPMGASVRRRAPLVGASGDHRGQHRASEHPQACPP